LALLESNTDGQFVYYPFTASPTMDGDCENGIYQVDDQLSYIFNTAKTLATVER